MKLTLVLRRAWFIPNDFVNVASKIRGFYLYDVPISDVVEIRALLVDAGQGDADKRRRVTG